MKPLPAPTSAPLKGSEAKMPSIPSNIFGPAGSGYSLGNRRVTGGTVQRIYPWLLFLSTTIAGVFCVMYITKPVVLAASGAMDQQLLAPSAPVVAAPESEKANPSAASVAATGLMPNQDRLPGENANGGSAATKPESARGSESASPTSLADGFEQTNLRMQHILTADAPGGQVAKIDLEVPVLYQSRNLRWTMTEVAEARRLLIQLNDYQERSSALRAEGVALLDSWNHLVEKTIPSGQLRADSPSLPSNQEDAADAPRPANLDTTEAVRIQPASK